MTSVGQPLDISIDKKFQTICKKQYLKHTNKLLEFLIESNGFAQITSQISSNIIKSNPFLFIYLFINLIVNNQVTMAQKNYKRDPKQRQASVATYLTKITVEDIYQFIENAYLSMKAERELIKRSFEIAKILTRNNPNSQRVKSSPNTMEIEVEGECEIQMTKENQGQMEEEEEVEDGIPVDINEFQVIISVENHEKNFDFNSMLEIERDQVPEQETLELQKILENEIDQMPQDFNEINLLDDAQFESIAPFRSYDQFLPREVDDFNSLEDF